MHPITWMEIKLSIPPWFSSAVAFVLGAVVGSFLNVCIHRLPRGESIITPSSCCASCGTAIRWFDNIPLISYLLLRGKCRNCGSRFSIRYWMVEWITALFFVVIWRKFEWMEAVAYTLFVCGLIVATFIDFEHYIISNEITVGGIFAGLICSGIVPSLQGERFHAMGFLWSFLGAAMGYGALWTVVELGKRVFGIKKWVLPKSTEVFLTSEGIRVGTEIDRWEEIFSRENDVLAFDATRVCYGEKTWGKASIRVSWREIKIGEESFELSDFKELTAVTETIDVPREAMGFGDVKFIAAIGAFLGPKAIFFVILVSSLLGSAVGLGSMFVGKKGWGSKLPYGPYLAIAAVIWMFWGLQWIACYFEWMEK